MQMSGGEDLMNVAELLQSASHPGHLQAPCCQSTLTAAGALSQTSAAAPRGLLLGAHLTPLHSADAALL